MPKLGGSVRGVPGAESCPDRRGSLVFARTMPSPARLISHPSHAPLLPAKKPGDLESTMPSEMALETNVLRYLANCLERRHGLAEGAVTLTSPTQPEENALGFDAMAGLPNGCYAALQFKRPKPQVAAVSFELPLRQFCAMLQYPPRSAFYILPIVCTNKEMWDVRTCLLDSTLAIDAQDLLAPFNQARLAHSASGKGAGSGECTMTIYVDLKYGTAYTAAPSPVSCSLIPFVRAGSLCYDSDRIGFALRNGIVKSRDGSSWGRRKWKRHVAEMAASHGDSVYILRGRDITDIGLDMERLPHIVEHLEEWAHLAWEPVDHTAERAEPDYGGNSYAIKLCDSPCR